MRESEIEKYLVSAVKRTGGIAVKNAVTYFAGFPDRTILFDGGKCVFVELKAPGKKPTALQRKRQDALRALGFRVYVIDSKQDVDRFIGREAAWSNLCRTLTSRMQ